MKLLIVEDNVRLAERLAYKLEKEFTLDVVHSGEDALEHLRTTEYSVILLDIGLPKMTGLDVCKTLRSQNNTTPILILSGLNAVHTRVELLSAGADDYVTKPFDLNELRARIFALKRRQQRPQSFLEITCGELRVNAEQHTVMHGDTLIELRRKEFDILYYMLRHQGQTVTRQMIMDHVWNNAANSWLSTIDVHIKHIRDKIDRPFGTNYLKTVYGVGYKIDAQQ
jgi:DNA-binding response OmpR family regulator